MSTRLKLNSKEAAIARNLKKSRDALAKRLDATRDVDLPELLRQRYGLDVRKEGASFRLKDARVGNGHSSIIFQSTSGWAADSMGSGSTIHGTPAQVVKVLEAELNKNPKATFKEVAEIIEKFKGGEASKLNIEAGQSLPKSSSAAASAKEFSFHESELRKTDPARDRIFNFVRERGISWRTVSAANIEHGGTFLDLTGNLKAEDGTFLQREGIRFLGRDADGTIMSTETRLIKSIYIDGEPRNKDTQSGSKKSMYPPILKSSKGSHVHIVEGGMDALALREFMDRGDKRFEEGHVIMSGGKGMTKFVETPHVNKMLKEASGVTIWSENEINKVTKKFDPNKTEITNQQLAKLAVKIAEVRGSKEEINIKAPASTGIKDVADWLSTVKADERAIKAAAAETKSLK